MVRRLLLVGCLTFVSAIGFAQHQRPEPNAFLDRRASSVEQLVAQAKDDPAVMDRFQRHFAMSREDVLRYLGSLHTARLSKSGVYTVYSVPDSGYIKTHAEKIDSGRAVFADLNGTPVLLVSCGNPLTLGPSHPAALAGTSVVPAVRSTHEGATVGEVTPAPSLLAEAPPEAPALAPVLPTPPAAAPQAAGVVAGGAGVGPWPLLLLPFAFIHGGGSSHTPAPVPEPATMLVLGAGLAYVARRRVKRSRPG